MNIRIVVAFSVVLLSATSLFAADNIWKIFDIKGKASILVDGSSLPISNEKNLLEAVRKGSLIKVEGNGKVVVVSLKNRQAFEIGDNSEGMVEEDQVRALKGSVTLKKGLPLPKGNDGKIGGIVMRGAGNKRSCLTALSPSNTAIMELTPELRWDNSCDGLKQVTITVLSDDKVVFSLESVENSCRIPEGVLQSGNRYMWLIDGGSNFDMASGIFSMLPEADRKEVLERKAAFENEGGDDIASMLAYIFFLDSKGLSDLSRENSVKVKQRFPAAYALKELP